MYEIVDAVARPEFVVTLLAAISAFATVLTIALPMLNRDRLGQRMKVMAVEREKLRATRLSELANEERGVGLRRAQNTGTMQQIVDVFDLRARFDNEEIRDKLRMAGLGGQGPLVTYMFFRLAMPVIVLIGAVIYIFFFADLKYPFFMKVILALTVGYVGYFLPDLFVSNLVQKRQNKIKLAFPDALDMLLICVQSGMSIEAAFGRVSKEVVRNSVELAEELSLTTAELSFLQERRQAFDNLGKRTGLPGVKAVATALIQAERYGTPISQALRVMAKENRDVRMAEAEKKAAALPPKLTVPMIIFFIPVLFVVILGPAAINFWKMQ